MYEYKAKVVEVTDGDTVVCSVDLGFKIHHYIKLRLADINAPETRTTNLEEKERGLRSKLFLESLILNKEVILKTSYKKTFDRFVGTLYWDDGSHCININQFMVSEGHATPYHR